MAVEDKKEEEEQEKPETVSKEDYDKIVKLHEDTRRKADEMERMILDPEYAEFMTERKNGKKDAEKKVDEEDEEADLDGMTPKQLTKYMLGEVQKMIHKEVSPLQSNIEVDKAMQDIERTAAKHEDFWDYKESMYNLAKSNPKLSAEQCYVLAKATTQAKPKRPATASETPSSRSGGEKPRPKGLSSAFDIAWKKSGMDVGSSN